MGKPRRRVGAGWIVALTIVGATATVADEPPRRPNLVLLVADDLGYADLGCHGGTDVATPRIDSLATHGVRCAQAYVTASVCAPSRAALLTGRYAQRFGFEHNPGGDLVASPDYGLPRDVPTLAERLRDQGYATGLVGKWHLGHGPSGHPIRRGFASFFGFYVDSHAYLPDAGATPTLVRDTEPVAHTAYLTDAFAREAVEFVERHHASPFCLVVAFNAVHLPLEADGARLARYAAIEDPRRRAYASMLSAMDDAVGAVLDALEARSLAASTLVVFLADNGGATTQTTARNAPLRAEKGTVYEGGVRVPLLARWPGRLPGGRTYEAPVSALDVVPTFLAAAGLPPAEVLDGTDLLPHWCGATAARPHAALFWRRGAQHAARVGDWKMVADEGDPPQLFDLVRDPGERDNQAARAPEKLAELLAAYQAWDRRNVAPAWTPGPAAPPARPRFGRAEVAQQFRRADTNGDGRLSPEELDPYPDVRSMLRGADANGDGVLVLDEVVAHFAARGLLRDDE